MTHPFLQRITTWLCLVAALLTGVVPAQGFVLCIEQDGCVRVEVKARDASCAGCEGHAAGALPEPSAASVEGDPGCPCVDLAVPGARQYERTRPRAVETQVGCWLAPAPVVREQPLVLAALPARAPPTCDPRPPAALALIRSVVLLV